MVHTTTTKYTCDLCGKAWTETEMASRDELPGIYPMEGGARFATSFVGTPPDYCDECVVAVTNARNLAIKERRQLKGR